MDQPRRPGGDYRADQGSGDGPSRSDLLPIRHWRDLAKKSWFLPGAAIVVVTMVLFATMGDRRAAWRVSYRGLPVDVPYFWFAVAFLILVGTAYAVYRVAGKRIAWYVMPVVMVLTAVLTMSPVMRLLQQIFAPLEIGEGANLLGNIVSNLAGAGLPEECLKAIPVAIGVWLATKITDPKSPLYAFRITEPLDAVLIGVAAGLGFALAETMLLYVPRTLIGGDKFAQTIAPLFGAMVKTQGWDAAAAALQKMFIGRQMALELMIPRLLGNIAGHAAYAGTFAYFIALGMQHPAQRWKTIGIGLAIAATMHACWNGVASTPGFGQTGQMLMLTAVALFAFGMLASCIVRARDNSPNRHALAQSQVLDRFSRIVPVPAAARAPTPATPATPATHDTPTPAAPAAAQPGSETWPVGLTIHIGAARIPAVVGARIYAQQTPGLTSSDAAGVVAEIEANPSNPSVLGIKNLSSGTWSVTTDRGDTRELAPGRAIRIASGTRLRLGDVTVEVK